MKLFHLSDLHIGKRLCEVSLIEDQKHILLQILEHVRRERPDAVLLCGDVYDKSIPTAEAVCLLDDFLCRLAELQVPVLVISGNHDSPERLAFGGRLMESKGIYISPVYEGAVKPVVLHDESGPVYFWLLPFVKPAHVRRFAPDAQVESYTDALAAAIAAMELDPSKRNVLLTHQFVTGCATCESEEVSVGGSDNVDTAVFAPFCYTALGHIHGPQNIGTPLVRYCGTPLKYSFSEESHHKSITQVALDADGAVTLQLLPLCPLRDLRTLKGSFAQLSDPAFYALQQRQDYLHICLTDEEDVPEALGKLTAIYPHLLKLTYDNTRTRQYQAVDAAQQVRQKSPLTLFEELYEKQNNQPMSQQQRRYTLELIDSIWEEHL